MTACVSIQEFRQAALSGGPGRLRRVIKYAAALGHAAISPWDAQEAYEDAIWADGALPADRPSQQHAWRLTLDKARDAYADSTDRALVRIAAENVAEHGSGYRAAYLTTWLCSTFAGDTEIARAVGIEAGRPWCPIRRARGAREIADDRELKSLRREAAIDRIEAAIVPIRAAEEGTGTDISVSVFGDEAALLMFAEETDERASRRDAIRDAVGLAREERIAMWEMEDVLQPELHVAAPDRNLNSYSAKPHPYDLMSPEQLRQLATAREAGILSAADQAMSAPQEAQPDCAVPIQLETKDSLEALSYPPGLVRDLIDWMESSSDRPNRALLLGAALTIVGTIGGRRFASPTNLRTNNYIVTLAPSGHGKDHALSQTKRLVEVAGLDRFVGPARIMSASALRKLIKREPAVACYIDEFGGFMSQIHDKRGGLHNAMIRIDLMEMFSSAGSFFAGSEYANEEAVKIYAPNFSFSGTSTPAQFWASLTSMSSVDGLLARMIVLDVNGKKPARRTPPANKRDVPPSLVAALHRLADAGRRAGNLAHGRGSAPEAEEVPLSMDGEKALAKFTTEVDELEARVDEDEAFPFVQRVREHAIKLALTVAIGVNPSAPVIDGPIMDWACRLAKLSMNTLIRESADRIADNDRAAAVNRVYGLIKGAGAKGITEGRIADRAKGIDARMRDQILKDLQMGGKVIFVKTVGTGGRASERYFAQ